MRTIRRMLALLVAAAMLAGATAALAGGDLPEGAPAVEVQDTVVTEAAGETGGTEGSEPREEAKGTESVESSGETENPGSVENPEGTEKPENTETSDDAGNSEGTENPENTENPEDAENPDGTESSEDVENPENAENDEAAEAPQEPDPLPAEAPALDAVTDPVDSSTVLPDGEYAPEGFRFSGGDGVRVDCERVLVSGGRARAVLAFGDSCCAYVKADNQRFDTRIEGGLAKAAVPVRLNADNRIVAMTTNPAPRELEYVICVTLSEAPAASDGAEEDEGAEDELPAEPQMTIGPDGAMLLFAQAPAAVASLDDAEDGLNGMAEEGLDGTTEPVDNSTALADGEYVPEDFSFSGGTGKTEISCAKVVVSGGRSTAVIAFSSDKYTLVKASGQEFSASVAGGASTFTIPVRLNADNRILATTTAMGKPREIEYTIRVTLTKGEPQRPGETLPEDGEYEFGIESSYKMFKIESASAKVSGGRVIVTIHTTSGSYDRIYLGSKDDAAREPVVQGTPNSIGGYDFTFELPRESMGKTINFVPGNAEKWYTNKDVTLTIPAGLGGKIEESGGGEDQPGESAGVEDGDYGVEVESSEKMFKVVKAVLTAKGGKYTAVITLSGTGYDYLFMGTAEAAAAANASAYIPFVPDAEGMYTYAIPVPALDAPFDVAAHSIKNDQWYDRQLTFKSETLQKQEAGGKEIEDGEYGVEVESSASMFKVVKAVLTAKGGVYTAVITLSGTGYDYLFMGTSEAAAAADASAYIPFAVDAEGKYTYEIPVPALDAPFDVAAHSIKNDQWYDRQLTFKSDTLQKGGEAGPSASPSPSPTPAPTQTPEADLSGSTGRVDSSTGLADGVYRPDSFSFSGGTGRVSISCPRVTVSGGRATATIVFSSTHIGYVKANGQKYYPSVGGGSSSFEIPVKLNANNRIIAMTTAMSQDHEVEYTIYVYLAAAAQKKGGADEEEKKAPVVPGLVYESRDELDAAKDFGIYRYEGGFAVIEVEGVGGYLVCGADDELPAGIEDSITVLRCPVACAYVAAPEIGALIEAIGDPAALAAVKLAGFEGGPASFAGTPDAPDYAALLAGGCDLAIVSGDFADARVLGAADAPRVPELGDEDAAKLADVAERLEMLGIPMLVDRSADEGSEAARLEWIKVYGVLFDCEEAAEAAYAAAVAALADAA